MGAPQGRELKTFRRNSNTYSFYIPHQYLVFLIKVSIIGLSAARICSMITGANRDTGDTL